MLNLFILYLFLKFIDKNYLLVQKFLFLLLIYNCYLKFCSIFSIHSVLTSNVESMYHESQFHKIQYENFPNNT